MASALAAAAAPVWKRTPEKSAPIRLPMSALTDSGEPALTDADSRSASASARGIWACARCCTLGSRVKVSGSVELTGVAEAMDDTGALLVRTEDGELHRVLAGDVSVRGVMGYV